MALILDTGPLYAALDRSDDAHKPCRRLIETAGEALVIPAPVLPEVDYLVCKRMGVGPFIALLDDIASRAYIVYDLDDDDFRRVRELVDEYSDRDVGFVDAAVLATVERFSERKLATLDRRHFSVLRPRHVEGLDILPN